MSSSPPPQQSPSRSGESSARRRYQEPRQLWTDLTAAIATSIGTVLLAAWLSGTAGGVAFATGRGKANTSLCLLFGGVSLLALNRAGSPRLRWLAAAFSTAMAVVGAATLLEYLIPLDLGIDQLLARDWAVGESALHPNRMAPNAALSMVLVGTALLCAQSRARARVLISQVLAVFVLVISLLALVGYLYGVSVLYQPTSFIRISAYTACGLVALCFGILSLRPELGVPRRVLSDRFGGYVTRRLLVLTLIVPIALGWLLLEGRRRGLYSLQTMHALGATALVFVICLVLLFLAAPLDALDEQRRESERHLRQSGDLSAALAQASHVDEVVQVTMDLGLTALGACAGAFYRITDHGKTLSCLAGRGYAAQIVSEFAAIPLDSPVPVAQAARDQAAVFIRSRPEMFQHFPPSSRETVDPRHCSWAVLPLIGRARTLGVIALSFDREQAFAADSQQRLTRLAWQCAQALERALLFDSEREARERARAAVAATSMGTWVWDLTKDVVYADDALADLLALSPEDLLEGVSLLSFLRGVREEEQPRVTGLLRDAAARRGWCDIEFRVRGADGRLRWMAARGCVEAGSTEEPAPRLLGALMDITEQKETESKLKAASERLHAALAAAAIGTYFLDIDSGEIHYDAGIQKIFALSEAEASLAVFSERIHPEDRAAWVAALDRCQREGIDFELRHRLKLPSGAIRWVMDKGQLSTDVERHARHLTAAIVDLSTEQQAREQAEAANRAKDEFLAMLGHELRNPLSPILTSLSLMKLKAAAGLERERAVIERQTLHMVRLVDDLLDVSRITRGKVELKRRPIEISEVLRNAVEVASPLLEQRQHRLELDWPEHGLLVEGDPERLAQVMSNLLTNAAKYTEPGGLIQLQARQEDGDLVIRVKDNGVGIPEALLPKLFDLFVQGERTIERSKGGLGLGLAIVRSLVELHGGSVQAQSPGLGRGSEFTIRLAAFQGPLVQPAVSTSPPVRAQSARRILVVDDNRDAAETLAEVLSSVGHEVQVAFDGAGALALAAEFRPAVAFLDIGLPVMDGYEVARRLRETNWGKGVLLVAITGYGQPADRERAARAGFDRHLVKPVDLEETLSLAANGSVQTGAAPTTAVRSSGVG